MKTDKISYEELRDMIEASFEQDVARFNNIGEFEVEVERLPDTKQIKATITIYGLAGSPTVDEIRNGSVKELVFFSIERADVGKMKLVLQPKMTTNLNGTDYQIYYLSENI